MHLASMSVSQSDMSYKYTSFVCAPPTVNPTSEEATTVGQKKLNATEDLRHATHLGATENSNITNQRLIRCPNQPDTEVRDGTVHGTAWF